LIVELIQFTMDSCYLEDTNGDTSKNYCSQARQLWLEASDEFAMKKVEELYRSVWIRDCAVIVANCPIDNLPLSKKIKLDPENSSDADSIWRQHGGKKLALILLQSSRTAEADKILSSLGYTFRLADSVLDYRYLSSRKEGIHDTHYDKIPCQIYDNFVQEPELNMLNSVFLNPTSSYWIDHKYAVEPSSPYFSYLIPLKKPSEANVDSGIISFLHRLQQFLETLYPVKSATYCEMWAHNRPHATGHQFHFDSDNEGNTKAIRNPICSCVVYLSDDVGGPSVITNQRLASHNLASVGWMSFPASGRLLVFDGKVLHGVVPGKGFCPVADEISTSCYRRRVSVMFAFWSKIRVRENSSGAGAAMFFPKTPLWAQQLQQPLDKTTDWTCEPIVVPPVELDSVFVSIASGKPWSRAMSLPDYEEIFQGF
jgi:hypothetical protein